MLKAKIIAFAVLFSMLFGACDSSVSETSDNNPSYSSTAPGSRQPEYAKTQDTGGGGGSGSGTGSGVIDNQPVAQNQVSLDTAGKSLTEPANPIERKIIRNAIFQLESDAPEDAQRKITSIAESKGGFVVESTQSGSDVKSAKRDTVTMKIRVPAEKFNETLDEIRKAASRVITETVKGQDVTEEFIDIEARLKTKKALEEQFLEIMKRSDSVADALNVQRELSNVRGEIEKIEGRKRFLESQASLSTIDVSIRTPTAIAGASEGFFDRLTEAVSTGLDAALSFILFFVKALIALLPFLILVVLPIWLVLRYLWRKGSRKIRTKMHDTGEIVQEEIKD